MLSLRLQTGSAPAGGISPLGSGAAVASGYPTDGDQRKSGADSAAAMGHERQFARTAGFGQRACPASVRFGEGFRMPSGVRKPPMHEPAGLRRWSMGISVFALPL